jgi:hypothetical protein
MADKELNRLLRGMVQDIIDLYEVFLQHGRRDVIPYLPRPEKTEELLEYLDKETYESATTKEA